MVGFILAMYTLKVYNYKNILEDRLIIMKNNLMIFGDSYSTFEGFIPENYDTYYINNGNSDTDVTNVCETWWHQVITHLNLKLVLNNSWSGSPISYTGYCGEDCSRSSSFIYRLNQLIEKRFFTENIIDKVFVFGGTNDSWANAPLGKMKFENWEKTDLYYVLPAICYFFNLLRETLPQAEIYCLINTELKPEISDCMLISCEKHNITPIKFDNIDKTSGHPTIKGMQDIKSKVLEILKTTAE